MVLATGLGKTWLSAFDSSRAEFRRVLFVAHRIRPGAHLGKYTGQEKVVEAARRRT